MIVRRRFLTGVICFGGASALAVNNPDIRETILETFNRYFGLANEGQAMSSIPDTLDPSALAADFIMDAFNADPKLRAEIVEWLSIEYADEFQVARTRPVPVKSDVRSALTNAKTAPGLINP
jgi:hypothetical protein